MVQGVAVREGRKGVVVGDQSKFNWYLSSSAPVFSPYCSGRFGGDGERVYKVAGGGEGLGEGETG